MASRARTLTEHEEIRQWAEDRGATPACVTGTGGGDDTGMIRLDFPGYSGEGSLQQISWDDWFQKFDESGLALLVQDTTAGGEKSNFNKLISRESARANARGEHRSTRRRAAKTGRRSASQGRSQRSAGTRSRSSASKRKATTRSRSAGARKSSSSRSRSRSQARSRRSSASSKRKSSKSRSARGSRSQSNNKQNRKSTRRVTLTIPKDVRIEAKKSSRGRGKRAA